MASSQQQNAMQNSLIKDQAIKVVGDEAQELEFIKEYKKSGLKFDQFQQVWRNKKIKKTEKKQQPQLTGKKSDKASGKVQIKKHKSTPPQSQAEIFSEGQSSISKNEDSMQPEFQDSLQACKYLVENSSGADKKAFQNEYKRKLQARNASKTPEKEISRVDRIRQKAFKKMGLKMKEESEEEEDKYFKKNSFCYACQRSLDNLLVTANNSKGKVNTGKEQLTTVGFGQNGSSIRYGLLPCNSCNKTALNRLCSFFQNIFSRQGKKVATKPKDFARAFFSSITGCSFIINNQTSQESSPVDFFSYDDFRGEVYLRVAFTNSGKSKNNLTNSKSIVQYYSHNGSLWIPVDDQSSLPQGIIEMFKLFSFGNNELASALNQVHDEFIRQVLKSLDPLKSQSAGKKTESHGLRLDRFLPPRH